MNIDVSEQFSKKTQIFNRIYAWTHNVCNYRISKDGEFSEFTNNRSNSTNI